MLKEFLIELKEVVRLNRDLVKPLTSDVVEFITRLLTFLIKTIYTLNNKILTDKETKDEPETKSFSGLFLLLSYLFFLHITTLSTFYTGVPYTHLVNNYYSLLELSFSSALLFIWYLKVIFFNIVAVLKILTDLYKYDYMNISEVTNSLEVQSFYLLILNVSVVLIVQLLSSISLRRKSTITCNQTYNYVSIKYIGYFLTTISIFLTMLRVRVYGFYIFLKNWSLLPSINLFLYFKKLVTDLKLFY